MATVYKREGRNKYYAAYFDHRGKRRWKCTGATDKQRAQRIANKWEAEAALRREGVIDASLESIQNEANRSIESHLKDFEAKLRTAKRSDKHIRESLRAIRSSAARNDWHTAAEIAADGVAGYASSLFDKGRAARTVEKHVGAIKQFTKWLVEGAKLQRDPLASVKKPNPQSDRKLERRELTREEWPYLDAATRAGPERYNMTGTERALLYLTAIQTALRSNELRSLKRGQLYLHGDNPYITCKPRSTKNKKPAKQYILPDLAAQLRRHIATKAPKAPVFGMPSQFKVAAMIRSDLADARDAWLKEALDELRDADEYARRQESDFLATANDEGEVFDFHALRHTCGAWLARAGVHPNVVKTVMRHSTIRMTMDTYGHLFPGEEASAVHHLGEILAEKPEALKATGTDDLAVDGTDPGTHMGQHSACETVRLPERGATPCEAEEGSAKKNESPKSLENGNLGDSCESVRLRAKNQARGAGRIRTADNGFAIRCDVPESQGKTENLGARTAHWTTPAVRLRAMRCEDPGFADPGLQAVIEAWADLPDSVRAKIVEIIQSNQSTQGPRRPR